jgi:hypothetical protein
MFFIFNKKSNKLDIKNRDGGVIFYAKKIERNKKEKWRRRLLVELEAEEYAKIDFKYFKKNQRIFYKAKHFFLWATRLLTPDFLIGHPNLFDNLKYFLEILNLGHLEWPWQLADFFVISRVCRIFMPFSALQKLWLLKLVYTSWHIEEL